MLKCNAYIHVGLDAGGVLKEWRRVSLTTSNREECLDLVLWKEPAHDTRCVRLNSLH